MDELTPAEFHDLIVARTPWMCGTCIPRSVSIRATDDGVTVQITHGPRCTDVAMWLTEPVPAMTADPNNNIDPDEGERA